jgi:hypothetical protein
VNHAPVSFTKNPTVACAVLLAGIIACIPRGVAADVTAHNTACWVVDKTCGSNGQCTWVCFSGNQPFDQLSIPQCGAEAGSFTSCTLPCNGHNLGDMTCQTDNWLTPCHGPVCCGNDDATRFSCRMCAPAEYSPISPEIPGDGFDNNNDGFIDEPDNRVPCRELSTGSDDGSGPGTGAAGGDSSSDTSGGGCSFMAVTI